MNNFSVANFFVLHLMCYVFLTNKDFIVELTEIVLLRHFSPESFTFDLLPVLTCCLCLFYVVITKLSTMEDW